MAKEWLRMGTACNPPEPRPPMANRIKPEPDYLVAYKAARAKKRTTERDAIIAAIGEDVKRAISAGENKYEVKCKGFELYQICRALNLEFPEFAFRLPASYYLIGGSNERTIYWDLKEEGDKS